MRVSITVRLALGFLLAALLAATATGIIGFQRMALLRSQSEFYQTLLRTNTTLTTGSDFLKAIGAQSTIMLADANTSHPEAEALTQDEQGLQSLLQLYNSLLTNYTTHDLLAQHPDQVAVLNSDNAQLEVTQQRIYAAGALRSWYLYEATQQYILQDIVLGHTSDAQALAHLQGEPEAADALSALHSLIQFNEQLAGSVNGATGDAITQSRATLLAAVLTFLSVALVGFFISRSLILRLKYLHRVTQAVKQGQIDARVIIAGHDEITDVSRSVNIMLDSLVAALQQATTARQQTDLAYAHQRQLNELKDHFIRHVGHELRTPLTEMYGFLQLLQDHRNNLDTEQQDYFVIQAIKGCEELITMCTTLLDASDQTAMIRTPQPISIVLADLIEELLAQQNPQESVKHPVYMKIPATLKVLADPQYVRQILRNLLSNAYKYTPASGPIFLETFSPQHAQEEKNGKIALRVRDTGPGIPPEEQPLLFQQFVRLKRDLAGNIRGTGLGLYLCRQFVEAMGERIWVESSGISGEGSNFCFTLAVVPSPTEALSADFSRLYSTTMRA